MGEEQIMADHNETQMANTGRADNKTAMLAGMALLTAVVIILQILGSFIRFGPFSISLVLIPIVVGAALYGVGAGAWLGFAFGLAVLFSGDAAAFLAVNPLGAVAVCLVKGALAGAAAGYVYRRVQERSPYAAALFAAAVCPVVNTLVFLIGCKVFFMDTITGWAQGMGFENVALYMIVGLVGMNFLVELLINVIFTPLIIRLIKIVRKMTRQ